MTADKATPSKGPLPWGRYLLLFCGAGWMFFVGLLVGRGTAPVRFDTQALQKQLAVLREQMEKEERTVVEKAIRGEDQKTPLDFYEALRAEGTDTGAQLQAKPAAAPPRPEGEQHPRKSPVPLMAKPAHRPGARPAAAPQKRRSPPGSVPSAGALTIQVAALKDADAAQRIVAKLKQEGYPAYLSKGADSDNGAWFRVRVGSYRDSDQAAADMARLTRQRSHPILVKKD